MRLILRGLGLRKHGKWSSREIRFLLYAVVALVMFTAWNVTENNATKVREIDDFADHRRAVGESNPLPLPAPVIENITQIVDFGDEEHVIVIDLRPEDPTHAYLDPNAKSNAKNIREAIKNEGKAGEVNTGLFRGQYLAHMDLGYKGTKHKKQRARGPTISEIRANPHSTTKKKTTRHPYARGHTSDIVYYQTKPDNKDKNLDRSGTVKDRKARGKA